MGGMYICDIARRKTEILPKIHKKWRFSPKISSIFLHHRAPSHVIAEGPFSAELLFIICSLAGQKTRVMPMVQMSHLDIVNHPPSSHRRRRCRNLIRHPIIFCVSVLHLMFHQKLHFLQRSCFLYVFWQGRKPESCRWCTCLISISFLIIHQLQEKLYRNLVRYPLIFCITVLQYN